VSVAARDERHLAATDASVDIASTQQRVAIRVIRVAFSTTEHATGLPALLLTAERGRE
jgi:hypothetical protein